MSVATPKRIVISTIGGKIQSKSPTICFQPHISPAITEDFMENGIKKRRRLTHLNQDQRLMRRKLKNRVAAQTARDRKKERMTQLEEDVQALLAENRTLQEENDDLRYRSKTLTEENSSLRERLGGVETVTELAAPESAALGNPQQQDRLRALVTLTTHCVTFLLTLSLTSSTYSRKSTNLHQTLKQKMTPPTVKRLTPQQRHLLVWWGSHQRNWNPAKN